MGSTTQDRTSAMARLFDAAGYDTVFAGPFASPDIMDGPAADSLRSAGFNTVSQRSKFGCCHIVAIL